MIYASRYDNEIRLWWDSRSEKTENMKYRVYVNGKSCVYTDRIYYNFKNLESGCEYEFEVQLVDQEKNIVGKTEKIKTNMLAKREKVDITKPPYCVIGDGVTDNTEIFKKAIKELGNNKQLYVPMGVYISEKLTFAGDLDIMFDVGAIICTKEKGKRL